MRSGFPRQKVVQPTNEWANTYNAAKGCIAIYVGRGKLTGETDGERKRFPTDPPDELR